MPDTPGISFAPTDQNLLQQRQYGQPAPFQEAIKILSLRRPTVLGASAPGVYVNGLPNPFNNSIAMAMQRVFGINSPMGPFSLTPPATPRQGVGYQGGASSGIPFGSFDTEQPSAPQPPPNFIYQTAPAQPGPEDRTLMPRPTGSSPFMSPSEFTNRLGGRGV